MGIMWPGVTPPACQARLCATHHVIVRKPSCLCADKSCAKTALPQIQRPLGGSCQEEGRKLDLSEKKKLLKDLSSSTPDEKKEFFYFDVRSIFKYEVHRREPT